MDAACVVLPSRDLQADIDFFTKDLGFTLKALNPSTDPTQAELSGFGLNIRLDTAFRTRDGACIVIRSRQAGDPVRSPGGTLVVRESTATRQEQTLSAYQAEISTLRNSLWQRGKAGMQTRELIPSRLGGAIAATHIRIPNGGPVADRVHYHTADFQLVFCLRGWIRMVFADQGGPIELHAGDCVTQPPHIRHQVLETSNGLEVLEISLPAEFVTAIDADIELPTGRTQPGELYDGQRFCHFSSQNALWHRHRLPGLLATDTGVGRASANIAGAWVLKGTQVKEQFRATHSADLLFSYVLAGSIRVNRQLLVAGDAFTLPPHEEHRFSDLSEDVLVLEISVPGMFKTSMVAES